MKVLFTPRAEQHIDRLHHYIADRSGFESRADQYVQGIINYCLGLCDFPLRGITRDDVLPGLRIVGYERRVTIAFKVEADFLLIEGIFYGGQSLENAFNR